MDTHSYAETRGDQTIVWLNGELDSATTDELAALLADSIALTRSDVIVDLSGVDFMGAAPVGVLMRARDFLERHSRTLVLRAPSPSAKLVLDLCGIAMPAPERADGVVIHGAARALASFVAVPAARRAEEPGAEAAASPTVRSESTGPAGDREPVSRAR